MADPAALQQRLLAIKQKLYPVSRAYWMGLIVNVEVMYLNYMSAMPYNNAKAGLKVLSLITSLGLIALIAEILTLGHVKTEAEWQQAPVGDSYQGYLKEFEEHINSFETRLPMLQSGVNYISFVQIPLAALYNYAHLSNPVTLNKVNENIGYCVGMGAAVLGKFTNYLMGGNNDLVPNQENASIPGFKY